MIYVVFRIAKDHQSRLSSLITCNYLVATLLGLIFFQSFQKVSIQQSLSWMPFGVMLGVLFIVMFFLIGKSSQKAGIAVTTLANKLSLVFPVLFSLLYYHEHISTIKYVGLAGAFIAIALTVYKKDIRNTKLILIALPLLIFLGSGMVDTLVKFVQAEKIAANEVSAYTTVVFFVAFVCGTIFQLIAGQIQIRIHIPTLLLGLLLGIVNFGSLYFIILALNNTGLNSSLVFALNNMSVVALTTVLGTLLFKEQLNKLNFAGIILAIISFYFLL
jgi:drug/metabolite transporter (DMT)-like permease